MNSFKREKFEGFFDLEVEEKNQKLDNYLVKKSFTLYKKNKKEFLNIQNSPIGINNFKKDFEFKFIFDKKGNNHYFKYYSQKKKFEKIWIYKKNTLYGKLEKIKLKSTIKLGSLEFFFEKISCDNENNNKRELNLNSDEEKNIQKINSSYYSQNITCRICLEEENFENPFEKNLCLCSEKMPAHIKCIKKWIIINFKTKNQKTYFFESHKIICNICNTEYSEKNKKKLLDTKMIEKKLKEFIKIRIINSLDNKEKGIFYINTLVFKNKEEIKIGTNDNSDLILKESDNISENHCSFVFKNNEIFLKDNFSRFGSFFLMSHKFYLKDVINDFLIIDRFSFHFFTDFKLRPNFFDIKNFYEVDDKIHKFNEIDENIEKEYKKRLVKENYYKYKSIIKNEKHQIYGNIDLIQKFPNLFNEQTLKKKKFSKLIKKKKNRISKENKNNN